jgi:hypothetical protein
MKLSNDHADRKATPITTGVLDYFPRALAYVAKVSKAGSDQHHPGTPLHWDKPKSADHADCIARHLIDRTEVDPADGLLHAGKLAWRALALLETMLEAKVEEKVEENTPRAILNAETGRYAHACPDLDQEYPPDYENANDTPAVQGFAHYAERHPVDHHVQLQMDEERELGSRPMPKYVNGQRAEGEPGENWEWVAGERRWQRI